MAKLAAVLLAAGASTRFGPENKLLVQLNGRPLVCGVAEAVLRGGVAEVVVITGYDEMRIKDALAGLPLRLVTNAAWEEGMGSSIAAGVRALSKDVAAAFVVPGDMPNLEADLLQTLADTFESNGRRSIVYPTTPEGEQRNPVLWPARYFAELAALTGAQGGKALLGRQAGDCIRVVLASAAACADVDTPADLAEAQAALPRAHRR